MGRKRKYPKELVEYIQQKRGISYRAALSYIKRHNLSTLEDARRLLESNPPEQKQEPEPDTPQQPEAERTDTHIKRVDPAVNEESVQENDFIAELISESEGENEQESENEKAKSENNTKFLKRLVEVSHRIAYRLLKSLFSVQFENDEQDLNELIQETVDIWVEELQNWGVQVDNNLIVLLVIYASYLSRLRRIEKKEKKKPRITVEEPKPNTRPIEMPGEYENEHESEGENETENENDPYAKLFTVNLTPGRIEK